MGIEKPDFAHAQKLDVSKNVEEYASIRDNMAMQYPFELDPFQQQAICCMERGDSVFVAAHTSAGKTVVAEYAVALCRKNVTRVIYTSPIKALSNQKFRDFKLAFDDVGLITGDIQLNSEANCLIMTTEILRSMLYNGSEVVRELEWVIFDEVHYINDIERGHVWEEVLIMLPSHVKIVMLSATVPNCMEFADWVGRIKHRTVYVIQTLKRPVPLEHFLYIGQDGKTRNDIFCIYREGNFLTSGYQKAVEAKLKKAQSQKTGAGPMMPRRGPGQGVGSNPWLLNKNNKNVYINLIEHLRTNELLPMIVFIFSRQRCDETAQLLQSVDLTSASEKSSIHRFFNRCIDRLKGSDKELPQVLLMQEHCKRGFAVHHSGILPIIKEVVEMLFQQGLVKILFATETFAMGVNMPARSVAFDTIEKHDGKERRLLNATEYVQMAGRAGRRGLDSTGTVIILAKGQEPPDIASLKTVLDGKPIKLESRFRMTYGMMLNLLRVEHLRIEDMLQRSYVERASLRLVVGRKERLKQIDADIEALPTIECAFCYPKPEPTEGNGPATNSQSSSIVDYFRTLFNYFDALNQSWVAMVTKSTKLFCPGRVIIIHHDPLGIVGRLAVVLKTQFAENGKFRMTLFVPTPMALKDGEAKEAVFKKGLTKEEQEWRKRSLLLVHALNNGIEGIEQEQLRQSYASSGGLFTVLEDIELDSLMAVCKRSIQKIDPDLLIAEHKRLSTPSGRSQSPDRSVRKILMELDQLAEKIDPLREEGNVSGNCANLIYILSDDMERKDLELSDRLRQLKSIREALIDPLAFPCTLCPDIKEHLEAAIKRRQLEEAKEQLLYQTSANSLMFSGEYVGRLKVLRTLNYIDRQNMVVLKGKVACEISNQELLITELILDNKFNDRSPAEIAAMFSALTCQFDSGKGGNNRQRGTFNNGYNNNHNNGQMPSQNATAAATATAMPTEGNANGVTNQPQQEMPMPEMVSKELLRELEKDLIEAASRIDAVQKACSVAGSVVDELKFGLMGVVYQWASGMEFSQIMRLSDAQEGTIVRCIQRLDEVCKDVRKAALIVGSPELAEKMEETSEAIRRDIVFAASLYVTETD